MASSSSVGTNLTQALEHHTRVLLSALDMRLQPRDGNYESRVADSERACLVALPTAANHSILAELDKRFAAGDSKWELRVGALEPPTVGFAQHRDECSSVFRADVEAHLSAATLPSVGTRAAALHVFDARRPRVTLPVFEDHVIGEQLAGVHGRLDNPITTFLGPNINTDGAAADGAAGRTVRAAAAGWSRVPHAGSDPYEPDGAALGRGRAGAATTAPGRHVRGLPQQAACHDQEGNYKIIAKAVNEVYRTVDPFGAVVARGNKQVASSHNLVQKEIDPSAHAAASTIRQAGRTAKYCSGNPSFRQRASTDPWVSKNGARKLFDEMPTSAWRSPSRVLEVTIRQVCYPMTESVIRAVFGQYGKVEQVHVLEASDQALARVVFYSKHDAADAFGQLHGRYVYNGCCQLDIEWGSFLDSVANQDVRYCNNTSNSFSDMFQASTTSTISMEVVVDKDTTVGVAATIDVDSDVFDDEPPTTCSRLGLDINTCVNQAAATFLLVDAVSEHTLAPKDSTHALSPKLVASVDISVVSSTCSKEGQTSDIGILVSHNSTEVALIYYPIFELLAVHPGRLMPSSLSCSLTWPLSIHLQQHPVRSGVPLLLLVTEQCIGNVAREGAELRSTLLVPGALWPLARSMLSNRGFTTRTAVWALSNIAANSFEHKKLVFASEVTQNEAAQLAAKYRGQGFQTLKLKIGNNFNSDIEVLASIRLDHPDYSFILHANEEYTYGSLNFFGLDTNTQYDMVCPYCDSGFVAELDDANALMSHFDGMDPDFHRDPRFGIMEVISVVMQHDMARMNKEVDVTGRPNFFSDLEIEFVIKIRDSPPMSLEALLETISCLSVHSFFVMVWDPGGIDAMYRLEGKPIFKKGGM